MHMGVIVAKEISHEECFVSAALDFSFSIFMHLMLHEIFLQSDLLKIGFIKAYNLQKST